jgi:phage tail-like protein
MALTKKAISTTYPLPAYNYRVTIGSETLSFSEVSGLTLEHDKVVYKNGLSFRSGYEVIRAQPKEVTITLKRGIVAKRTDLYSWMKSPGYKDISIDLCDETGKPVVRWKATRALPLKMDAPSFNASGNDIAVESIELIAQELTIEHL